MNERPLEWDREYAASERVKGCIALTVYEKEKRQFLRRVVSIRNQTVQPEGQLPILTTDFQQLSNNKYSHESVKQISHMMTQQLKYAEEIIILISHMIQAMESAASLDDYMIARSVGLRLSTIQLMIQDTIKILFISRSHAVKLINFKDFDQLLIISDMNSALKFRF